MKRVVKRPAAKFSPAEGILRADHFQTAYVTTDIERACTIFSDRYGIREYQRLEGDMPGGGHIRLALAWAGGTMIELVQAEGPAAAFYTSRLPSEGFAIRHHHLGYFIQDEAEWAALVKTIERGGWNIVAKFTNPGMLEAWYIEAPELGHYLEYLYPEPAGVEFFENVPSS